MKIEPNALAGLFSVLRIDLTLPVQQATLECIDERIGEIRADIVSCGKTPDEIDVLLDELQRLIIKKHYTEGRIGQIKHMLDICKKRDEVKHEIEKLKKVEEES